VPFAVERRSGLAPRCRQTVNPNDTSAGKARQKVLPFGVAGHHKREAALGAKPHINCRQLIDFIMSYQENELPPGERAEFERHLAACPPCQAYLDTYDKTVELAKQSGAEDPVPAEVPESLIAAILAARTPGKMS